MKKSKIIIQLLKEKYEVVANTNVLLQQHAACDRTKDERMVNLAQQIAELTEKNEQLSKRRFEIVATSTSGIGLTAAYIFDDETKEIKHYVLEVPDQPLVVRQEKFKEAVEVPRGVIAEQISPPRTGKSTRARAWEAGDPENRRIVDGDREEAERLANLGFDVILNLYPEQ